MIIKNKICVNRYYLRHLRAKKKYHIINKNLRKS